MSIFTSTRSVLTETLLPASALALLHDHMIFQNLQHLAIENKIILSPPTASWLFTQATAISESGVKPEYRSTTVAIPFGPFGSNNITTTSAFIDTNDGLIIVFQAPMVLYGMNQWSVVTAENGEGLMLREEAMLTGFVLLMPFVMMTKKESQVKLAARFVRKLEEQIGR